MQAVELAFAPPLSNSRRCLVLLLRWLISCFFHFFGADLGIEVLSMESMLSFNAAASVKGGTVVTMSFDRVVEADAIGGDRFKEPRSTDKP